MGLATLIRRELETPTGQVGPLAETYARAMSGVGHAVLGAACVAPFGWWGLGPAFVLALIYWLAKERGDLRRGGKALDGVEDAVCVCLGAWYGVWWWPMAALAAAGIIMASAVVRAK